MYNTMGTAVKLCSMCIQPEGSGIYTMCRDALRIAHTTVNALQARPGPLFRGAGAHADGVNLQEIVGAELPGTSAEAATLAL